MKLKATWSSLKSSLSLLNNFIACRYPGYVFLNKQMLQIPDTEKLETPFLIIVIPTYVALMIFFKYKDMTFKDTQNMWKILK